MISTDSRDNQWRSFFLSHLFMNTSNILNSGVGAVTQSRMKYQVKAVSWATLVFVVLQRDI